MITPREIEEMSADLAATLADVLSTVLSQEAAETTEPMAPGLVAIASLAILDETSGGITGVELQVGTSLAQVLAGRMMSVAAPQDEDIIDAVSELGNIAAGSAKSLLFKHARLSLPMSRIQSVDAGEPQADAQAVRAIVLGHVVQLTVIPHVDAEGLIWPPVVSDELIGRL
jgi:CheY-specific phosphatase CheX